MTHEARALALCEKWFDTKARASWCPAMVDEFATALREVERETWEHAAERLEIEAEDWCDELAITITEVQIMKQALFNKAPQDRSCGMSLQGRVDISYAELVRIFGPPYSDGDGEKVDAEWIFTLHSGRTATIYNYKTGKNYNGNEGQATEEITDWHIGGTTKAVVGEVLAIIENSSFTEGRRHDGQLELGSDNY